MRDDDQPSPCPKCGSERVWYTYATVLSPTGTHTYARCLDCKPK